VARKPGTTGTPPQPRSPRPAPKADRESVSVRKIHNGYITTRLGTKDGAFFKHESYSRSQPVVSATAPKPKRAPARDDEVGFLNRRQ